jgi:glycosyltransferase involved in cell wall biosynthesis
VPRVSVIIPVYNLAAYLPEAIESALGQTLPPNDVEVVVVDDGSTDGSGEIARRYAPRVRVVRQENRGLPAARNAGLRATSAPFVNFLDADDRLLPDKLAAQLAVFARRPDAGVVTAGVRYVDARGALLFPHGWARVDGAVLPQLVLGNFGPPHALLLRRAPLLAAGGFDETLAAAEDWDLWLRLARAGVRWALVDRPLADYRVRPDALHQNPERMAQSCLRVLDKVFADPALPQDIRRLRPRAYQNVALTAACDHYRAGDRAAGGRWLRAAVRARPGLLSEPRGLRRLCRLLLPVEQQSEAAVLADWRRLTAALDTMLRDLFAAPDLEPEIARLRRRARLAYWRTVARCWRKTRWM